MTMDPLDFLDSIAGHTQARYPVQTARLGTVDPAYTSGNPKITFDGESTLSGKTYLYAGYTPTAGDRVVLLPVGNSWLILGAVGQVDGATLLATIAGKAAAVHTHAESDVTGLVTDLANRSPGDTSHVWTGSVSAAGSFATVANWSQSRSAGIATMTSSTNLKLNNAGKWSLVFKVGSDDTAAGLEKVKLAWGSGPWVDGVLQDTRLRGSGFAGAGNLDSVLSWTGYVSASHASNNITAQCLYGSSGGTSITHTCVLEAYYLGT